MQTKGHPPLPSRYKWTTWYDYITLLMKIKLAPIQLGGTRTEFPTV